MVYYYVSLWRQYSPTSALIIFMMHGLIFIKEIQNQMMRRLLDCGAPTSSNVCRCASSTLDCYWWNHVNCTRVQQCCLLIGCWVANFLSLLTRVWQASSKQKVWRVNSWTAENACLTPNAWEFERPATTPLISMLLIARLHYITFTFSGRFYPKWLTVVRYI